MAIFNGLGYLPLATLLQKVPVTSSSTHACPTMHHVHCSNNIRQRTSVDYSQAFLFGLVAFPQLGTLWSRCDDTMGVNLLVFNNSPLIVDVTIRFKIYSLFKTIAKIGSLFIWRGAYLRIYSSLLCTGKGVLANDDLKAECLYKCR